ncbi:MAG: hypothetical protein JNL96_01730 [Planctomycetaceae bacterium]|nr:hypothetical protein [Planctomycetaceae bacterium]
MSKTLTMLGLIVALVMLAIFAADAFVGWPFRGYSMAMDYGFIAAALLLGYMSISTFRELP